VGIKPGTFAALNQRIALGASEVDGDTLSCTVADALDHGILSGMGANRTYAPASTYNGPDSFTYKASDCSADSNVATVITINAVNDAPTATVAAVARGSSRLTADLDLCYTRDPSINRRG
jgi:hypothetical protein